jgi:heme-degrading monooxygenase HmoA
MDEYIIKTHWEDQTKLQNWTIFKMYIIKNDS